jgi:hypothetical protein
LIGTTLCGPVYTSADLSYHTALAGASSVAVYQGPQPTTARVQSKSSKPDKAVASGRVEKKKKKKKKKAPKSKDEKE